MVIRERELSNVYLVGSVEHGTAVPLEEFYDNCDMKKWSFPGLKNIINAWMCLYVTPPQSGMVRNAQGASVQVHIRSICP